MTWEPTSSKERLDYILKNRAELIQSAQENILDKIKDLAYEEEIHGPKGLALSIGWEDAYMEFDISEHRFLKRNEINRHEDFYVVVGPEGELIGGAQALEELRKEIQTAIDDVIADLREEISNSAKNPAIVSE
jgi:hypothetical protein